MKTKILIFGSCVSRDPFGDPIDPKGRFEIADYYARSSLASLAAPPTQDYKFSKIASPFQRRMVERDFSKCFLSTDFKSIDLVLIDFIDDRYPLLKFGHNSFCTESEEFKKSEVQLDAIKVSSFSDDFYCLWEAGWMKLLAVLRSHDMLNSIIINKVFLATHDDKGIAFEQQQHIAKMNAWLERLYTRLAKDLIDQQFVDYGPTDFVAKSDHKWGRSPFHYTPAVENALLSFVSKHCAAFK